MTNPDGYLRVRNWDRFQHYKDRKPIWIKYHVDLLDNTDLRELPYSTRLLWDQILLLTARYGNPIEADYEAIAKLTRIDLRSVREGVASLIAKRMLTKTRTRRKGASQKAEDASEPASNAASEPASPRARPRGREEVEVEREKTQGSIVSDPIAAPSPEPELPPQAELRDQAATNGAGAATGGLTEQDIDHMLDEAQQRQREQARLEADRALAQINPAAELRRKAS
jgi:hypothetical protein